jgi:hypothetical protein
MMLLSLLFAAAPVSATEPAAVAPAGVVWTFPAPRRYWLTMEVVPTYPLFLNAFDNLSVRAGRIGMTLDTTCAVRFAVGKKGWDLECVLNDVALQVQRSAFDTAVQPELVVEELDRRLTGVRVEVNLSRDGRVNSVGFTGFEGTNSREVASIEMLRQLVSRAFAAMDLQLPAKEGLSSWTQTSPWAMNMVGFGGTLGSVATENTVLFAGEQGVIISAEGRGAIRFGTSDNMQDTVDLTISGSGRFDPAQGTLVERQLLVEGTPTSSSVNGGVSPGNLYSLNARLRLVPEGQQAPAVGPSGVSGPPAPATPAQ